MKTSKNITKTLLLIILFFFCITFNTICYADTDVINDYTIKVNPRKDGSLDINYHIEWEVLDSSSVGPLYDLYVGIPNEHVDSIVGLSKNIQTIGYSNSSNGRSGDYVHIKFNKQYHTGDIAIIDFSLHQSYMYTLDGSRCSYSFTPGYFNDVKVKNASILWNSNNVIDSTTSKQDDGYYVWKKSLSKGSKITAKVEYYQTVFSSLDTSKQYNSNSYTYYDDSYYYDDEYNNDDTTTAIGMVLFIIIVVAILASTSRSSSYYSHRGYGYGYSRPYYHHHHHHHHHRPYRSSSSFGSRSSSSRSSCVSSCACACACAGGGRAGCSRKDLFGIKTKDLKNVLRK